MVSSYLLSYVPAVFQSFGPILVPFFPVKNEAEAVVAVFFGFALELAEVAFRDEGPFRFAGRNLRRERIRAPA